jgi:tetratricopeptide (TPR) repeat protein
MDATPVQTGMPARKVLPVFGVLVIIIAGMGIVNTLLVRVAREHRYETGHELFRRAQELRAAGRNSEALDAFRSAYNRDPANVEYQLGFIRALRGTGRVREARNSLGDLLRRKPAEGAANTEMARMLAAEGNWKDSAWYYHRALYGQWENSVDERRLRFELADLLAANGAKQELLAELLLLGEPADTSDARHIGRLLLAASDWPRAEELFRSQLERNRSDPELWAGLGRAQIGSGKYLAAERSFRKAGDSEEIRNDLDLVTRVNALDPGLRRIGTTEKHRRAHQLASELVSALRRCAPQNPTVLTADGALSQHADARRPAEFVEPDLDLVDQLWTLRREICPSGAPIPKEAALLAAQISR